MVDFVHYGLQGLLI